MIQETKGSIRVLNVNKSFRNVDSTILNVLDNISISVEPGSFVSIVGESGCGKSTLLRILAGLEKPDSGILEIGGTPVNGPDVRCGMMFQQNILFPWLTVEDNIAFGPKMIGKCREKCKEVDRLMEMTGIKEFAKSYPAQLSGGMQQRAALARALATDPEVLLLDEPLGALDAFTRMRIQDELLRIWNNKKNTMLMITHDIEEVMQSDDCIVLNKGKLFMHDVPEKVFEKAEQLKKIDLDVPFVVQVREAFNKKHVKKQIKY